MIRNLIVLLVLGTLMVFAFINETKENASSRALSCGQVHETVTIFLGGKAIEAYLADTPEKQVCGLSYRERLEENEGMLFVFPKTDFYGIWMKEMRFPIDIVWLNDDRIIVDIAPDVSPDTYPAVFKPKAQSRYVLEVNAGFIRGQGISLGDQLELD